MRAPVIRPSRPALCAAAALLLLAAAPARAQENRDLQCIQQYNTLVEAPRRLDPTDPGQVARGCLLVAEAVRADWPAEALFAAPAAAPGVDPRDLSATRGQTTTSPGETTAPIEPVEAAGGSVAAVGTDKGAGAVAAVAINPSIFFIDPTDSEQVARWSRFMDFTLLVPASDMDGDGADGENDAGMDYVGVRWGVNLTGLRQGSEMHQAVVAAYNAFLATGTSQNAQIQQLLRNAATEDALGWPCAPPPRGSGRWRDPHLPAARAGGRARRPAGSARPAAHRRPAPGAAAARPAGRAPWRRRWRG